MHALKNWRKKNGHTQESFGKLIGVNYVTVSRYENGESKPTLRRMQLIREVTGGEVLPRHFINMEHKK